MKYLSFWEETALGVGLLIVIVALLGFAPVFKLKPAPAATLIQTVSSTAAGNPEAEFAQVRLSLHQASVEPTTTGILTPQLPMLQPGQMSLRGSFGELIPAASIARTAFLY